MSSVMSEITKYTKDALILMITNPLDVATYHVSTQFDYPREKSLVLVQCLKLSAYAESLLTVII